MVGDGHAESAEPGGDGFADATETENAGGFTAESGGQGELAREPVALVQKAIGLDKATAGHEDKCRGKVGDVVSEHVWSVGEANPALPAGGKVHAIVTDPAEGDDFEIGQAGEEVSGDLGATIANEGADGRWRCRKQGLECGRGGGVEASEVLLQERLNGGREGGEDEGSRMRHDRA